MRVGEIPAFASATSHRGEDRDPREAFAKIIQRKSQRPDDITCHGEAKARRVYRRNRSVTVDEKLIQWGHQQVTQRVERMHGLQGLSLLVKSPYLSGCGFHKAPLLLSVRQTFETVFSVNWRRN